MKMEIRGDLLYEVMDFLDLRLFLVLEAVSSCIQTKLHTNKSEIQRRLDQEYGIKCYNEVEIRKTIFEVLHPRILSKIIGEKYFIRLIV